MSKSLAVIPTPDSSFQLDVAKGGGYFAIPGQATLTDALRIRLSELHNLASGARVTNLHSRDARRTFGTGVDMGLTICNEVTARAIEGELPLNLHNISLGI